MFNNILVPLDGSKLAETALIPAEYLSISLGAPITLLHVIEKDAPHAIHNDRHLSEVSEAVNYLNDISKAPASKGILMSQHVHTAEEKDVAASIIRHSRDEFNPDLIVMCAHGKGGIRDLMFGNIAQQVLAAGVTPLLLLQPESIENNPFSINKIFLPLDNESRHDESVEFAIGLAKAFHAEIDLLTVIPTFSTLTGHEAAVSSMLPATSIAFLDIQEENAREHLQSHMGEFIKEKIDVKAEIGRGDAAELIVATAAKVRADLILLSTHRKVGMEAFWARSVAPNVVRKTHIPILLIPLGQK